MSTQIDLFRQQHALESHWLKEVPGGGMTSLDLSTDAGRKGFVASQQKKCISLDECINREIDIRDVLLHPAMETNPETGEVKLWTRIVLFLADGTMVACGSGGVLKSLRLASVFFGPPPWTKAIGTVVQVPLDDSKRFIQIEWKL